MMFANRQCFLVRFQILILNEVISALIACARYMVCKSQLREMKELEKQNTQLKKIVAELELDKLILKESLDFLKPKV